MDNRFAIKSNRVVCPDGIRKAIIIIEDGKIIDIADSHHITMDVPVKDVGDSVLMPGLIDPHVHINEPGRTDWEGFDTATKAAAASGITTLVDMPLNSSPVTTSVKNFEIKLDAAKGKLNVNCGFWGGVVPDNLNQLEDLLKSGVFGLKAFLTHSGIDDFPNTTEKHLRIALALLKKYDKPLLVHCELDEDHAGLKEFEKNSAGYSAYLKSRPCSWENKAIEMMIRLCRETKARVHIVHLSSAEAIPMIVKAKQEGLPLTVETGQHYLFFNAEEIPDRATQFKCAPPIREKANNEMLWKALADGTIDFVATDHSPAPPELKEISSGNFKKAWGGIAGLQFALPVLWTAAKKRGFSVTDISKWMSSNPASFLHLDEEKGKIEKGYDADLVIWNPEREFTAKAESIQHKHKITPYADLNLLGFVEQTFLSGVEVYNNGNYLNLNAGKALLK